MSRLHDALFIGQNADLLREYVLTSVVQWIARLHLVSVIIGSILINVCDFFRVEEKPQVVHMMLRAYHTCGSTKFPGNGVGN